MKKYIIAIAGLISLVLASCVNIKVPGRDVTCPPPPPQNCQPAKWSGMPVDTSESFRKIADEYYTFSPVHSINTNSNEWGLSFIDNTKAVLTFDDQDQQRMVIAKFFTDTKASIESGLGSPFDGSSGALSIRGNKVVLAATSDPESPDDFIGNSNLYTAELSGNMIKNAKVLNENIHKDKITWESHPSLSPDGDVVFFASDRNLGRGTDLFLSYKQKDGKWSEAISLGDSLNTICEEITPFVTADGKSLYFSSCGHQTVGGYDIFVSAISPEFWTVVKSGNSSALSNLTRYFGKPRNLRPPLNTPADEIFPSSPESPDNILYYASNQISQGGSSIVFLKGGFDIYKRRKVDTRTKQIAENNLDIPININVTPVAPSNITTKTYTLKGTVYNAQTKQVVPNAELIIRQKDGPDPTLNRDYLEKDREVDLTAQGGDKYYDAFKITADENGRYTVELEKDRTYEVTAQKEDMFFDSFKTRVENEDPNTTVEQDLFIPPDLTLRINFPSDVYRNPYKYSLDSNGVETNQSWQDEITLLAQNLIISKNVVEKLILIGHTDEQGTDEYNLKLGLNRVNFIIDELVRRGVPRTMLDGQSAGETLLLPKLSDEGLKQWRKRCRRVELQKVMKTK